MLLTLTSFIFITLNLGVLMFQLFLKISKFRFRYLKEVIEFTVLMMLYNSAIASQEFLDKSTAEIATNYCLIALFIHPILILVSRVPLMQSIRISRFRIVYLFLISSAFAFIGDPIQTLMIATYYSLPIGSVLIGFLLLSFRDSYAPISSKMLQICLFAVILLNLSALTIYMVDFEFFGLVVLNVIFLFVIVSSTKEYAISLIRSQTAQPANKRYVQNQFYKYGLTTREIEIAELMLQNCSYQEIANHCSIDKKTVGKHASNIFTKVSVSKKSEFVSKFSNLLTK